MSITFSYRATDKDGKATAGKVQAETKEQALAKIQELKTMGLTDISIERAETGETSTTTKRLCPFCAEEIQPEAIKCRHCGEMLDGSREAEAKQNQGIEKKIAEYVRNGYLIQHRDESRVQLLKKKKFSFLMWLFWWIAGGILGLVFFPLFFAPGFYILYHIIRKDKVVNLEV